MMRSVYAFFALSFGLAVGSTYAQGRHDIDQIGASGTGASEQVQQITTDGRQLVPQAAPPQPRTPSTPQLTVDPKSQLEARQLTSEGRVVRAPVQLYRGGRTAQPSDPLSRPSEGRTGAVTEIAGKDRCDPERHDEDKREACARVIETRSAEFERQDPITLSPEQRLLVEQRLGEARASARASARRLATPGMDPESVDEQGVASLVLGTSPRPTQEKPAKDEPLSPETSALVSAILNAASGGTGPD